VAQGNSSQIYQLPKYTHTPFHNGNYYLYSRTPSICNTVADFQVSRLVNGVKAGEGEIAFLSSLLVGFSVRVGRTVVPNGGNQANRNDEYPEDESKIIFCLNCITNLFKMLPIFF